MNFLLGKTIHDEEGKYLTRFYLTPPTPWGQLYLHWFHKGDADRALHDHPWDFWTFPFSTYVELSRETVRVAIRWRWNYRPATHRHRVLGKFQRHRFSLDWFDKHATFFTLVWRGPKKREWGFWPDGKFVRWDVYLRQRGLS